MDKLETFFFTVPFKGGRVAKEKDGQEVIPGSPDRVDPVWLAEQAVNAAVLQVTKLEAALRAARVEERRARAYRATLEGPGAS